VNRHQLRITPSIGRALDLSDGCDRGVLAKSADAAMDLAKRRGRNESCFQTAEVQPRSARRLVLESAQRRAPERGDMQLHDPLQGSLHAPAGIGAKVLRRGPRVDLGAVSPAAFISTAESSA
jgi:diguanylate cyclase